jgi:methionyl-tRNA formyltransferase
MSIKILILTTETIHHVYFAKRLAATFANVVVYSEEIIGHKFLFDTHHPYEVKRDQFEIDKWFDGVPIGMSRVATTKKFDSLNSLDAIKSLSIENPDLVIVFGTNILRQDVINLFPQKIFNLHGGDPERYRGLDNHLWGIYHSDFSSLVTTLHHVNHCLDAGDIVAQGDLKITPEITLESLRSINTELCVEMATVLIDAITRFGVVPSRRQLSRGRYYSAMPSFLKEICIKKFNQRMQGQNK